MPFDQDAFDRFEAAIERLLGDRVRSDEAFCRQLYSSLTNFEWHHSAGGNVGYSFRSAGSLIARNARRGCYLDWYCRARRRRLAARAVVIMPMGGAIPPEELSQACAARPRVAVVSGVRAV